MKLMPLSPEYIPINETATPLSDNVTILARIKGRTVDTGLGLPGTIKGTVFIIKTCEGLMKAIPATANLETIEFIVDDFRQLDRDLQQDVLNALSRSRQEKRQKLKSISIGSGD